MGLVFGFLIGVFLLCLLGICVIGAMWESVKVPKDLKKIEQQRRRQSQ
jgi:hypothetical protein